MATESKLPGTNRMLSLDVMRGIIMLLLAGESAEVYKAIKDFNPTGLGRVFINQFFHHSWNGLRFWDLVQPAFMLMAGAALYLSYYYKSKKGVSWGDNLPHVLSRCLKLFIFGVALHCIYSGKLVWELWNVLTQLAITTVIAYLIIRKTTSFQLIVSIGLLVLTEMLYRATNIPGFDQPFVKDHNFGSWFDMLVMGKLNPGGGWVTINFLPTAAHTIWGALAGKLLVSNKTATQKIRSLLIAGTAGLVFGYGLDMLQITPIIKRIATSSFTLVSGGWVLLFMAFLYWLIDLKKQHRFSWIFTVVGMNSIFIYLFFETVGHQWLNKTVGIFIVGFSGLLGAGPLWQHLLSAFCSLGLLWCLCYWLYQRKIFFKL